MQADKVETSGEGSPSLKLPAYVLRLYTTVYDNSKLALRILLEALGFFKKSNANVKLPI
jgi:hypothetical protein